MQEKHSVLYYNKKYMSSSVPSQAARENEAESNYPFPALWATGPSLPGHSTDIFIYGRMQKEEMPSPCSQRLRKGNDRHVYSLVYYLSYSFWDIPEEELCEIQTEADE